MGVTLPWNSCPGVAKIYLEKAFEWASHSNCGKRHVGCVFVYKGKIVSVGYNTIPYKTCDCNFSNAGSNRCRASHAECVAIANCKDCESVDTCYLTLSPCWHCTKALLATGCKQIVFAEYCGDIDAERIWIENNRRWLQVQI